MGTYRYAVYHNPRLNIDLKGKSIIAFPFKFFCKANDLDPIVGLRGDFWSNRANRLQATLDRIYSGWNDVGPEYCYHLSDKKPEQGAEIYLNPKRVVSFHDGGPYPLIEIGKIQYLNRKWSVIPTLSIT